MKFLYRSNLNPNFLAHVLIIGCGGLGSAASLYLASAGVGKLVVVDDDEVDSEGTAYP